MPEKEPKSPAGFVLAILRRERGLFYSAREIAEMINDRYGYQITRTTIARALVVLGPALQTKVERWGAKKVPVTLYCLPQNQISNV